MRTRLSRPRGIIFTWWSQAATSKLKSQNQHSESCNLFSNTCVGADAEESKYPKHILKIYHGHQIYITCVGADVEGLLYRTSTTDNAVVPQEHHLWGQHLYFILCNFHPFHLHSTFVQLIVFGKTLNFQNILCTIWERMLKWFLLACSISICKIPNRETLRNICLHIWNICLHIWNIWIVQFIRNKYISGDSNIFANPLLW